MRFQILMTIWLTFVFVSGGFVRASEVAASDANDPGLLELLLNKDEFVGALPNPVDELMALLDITGPEEQIESVISDSNSHGLSFGAQAGEKPTKTVLRDSESFAESGAVPVLMTAAVESTAGKEFVDVREDFRNIRQQFLLDQMRPVEVLADAPRTGDLSDLIRQLEALEIPAPRPPVGQSVQEPGSPDADLALQSEVPLVPESSAATTPEQDMLSTIEKAETILCPLRLADVLYRQGCFQQSLRYYQQVYDSLDEEKVIDRQWTIFQMANCYRQSDSQKAIQLYSELISSYPNSKWSAAALSRQKTIEWKQANRIEEMFVKKTKNDDTN